MKLLLVLIAISFFAKRGYSQSLQPETMNEITQAQMVLDRHASECGGGASGWWLKLSSSLIHTSVSGGMSSSTGEYFGCGSCNDCRTKLNTVIDKELNNLEQYCRTRGGTVQSSNRGQWKESFGANNANWVFSVSNGGIVCEKWVPCD